MLSISQRSKLPSQPLCISPNHFKPTTNTLPFICQKTYSICFIQYFHYCLVFRIRNKIARSMPPIMRNIKRGISFRRKSILFTYFRIGIIYTGAFIGISTYFFKGCLGFTCYNRQYQSTDKDKSHFHANSF